jgi:hypothetical protein
MSIPFLTERAFREAHNGVAHNGVAHNGGKNKGDVSQKGGNLLRASRGKTKSKSKSKARSMSSRNATRSSLVGSFNRTRKSMQNAAVESSRRLVKFAVSKNNPSLLKQVREMLGFKS